MLNKTKIALAAALVIGTASTALANDSGGYAAWPRTQPDDGYGYTAWPRTQPDDGYGYAAWPQTNPADAYGYAASPKQTHHRVSHARTRDR
jgi:hypothetical protein